MEMEMEHSNNHFDEEFQNANLEVAYNCYWAAYNDIQPADIDGQISNGGDEFINCSFILSNCFQESINFVLIQLNRWREKQRHLSIGPIFFQNQHYLNLNDLRQRFTGIQGKLKATLDSVLFYKDYTVNNTAGANLGQNHFSHQASQFYWQLHQMAIQMLTSGIVFSQQPPAILQINRADVNAPRASRNRFDLGIELLGATVWLPPTEIFDQNANCRVCCFVRRYENNETEEEAIQGMEIYRDQWPCNEDFMPSQREECPNFELVPSPNGGHQLALVCKYSRLGVNTNHDAARKNMRRQIQNIRYRFCFYIDIKLSSEIRVNSWVLTLPFAVTHGKNVQVKTEAILQRAFPAFSKNPEAKAEAEMICQVVELMFQEEICSNDIKSNKQMMRLSEPSKKHLMVNLGMKECGQQNLVPLMNFFEITEPNLKIGHNLRFNEWLFRLTEIIRDAPGMRQLWENGLIYGFCGKLEGEEILRANYQVRMMVIRFSDTSLYGDIKITYGKQNYVQHACFDGAYLMKNNLAIELLENDKFHHIHHIYNAFGQPVDLRIELNQMLNLVTDVDEDDINGAVCSGDGSQQLNPLLAYTMNQVHGTNRTISNHDSGGNNGRVQQLKATMPDGSNTKGNEKIRRKK